MSVRTILSSLPAALLRLCAVAGLLLVAPAIATAQYGAIAGGAKDSSGAVLPGVTVEASSPALIEKVRAAVTDASGQYKIIDLQPGTYSVTFTLPGFTTVKHERIALDAGFTAAVSAEMKVGGLEETVVVSASSPVVDVQNVRTQQVLTRQMVDVLPTARAFQQIAKVMPAIQGNADVGGTNPPISPQIRAYGGRNSDQALQINGMSITGVQFSAGSTTLTGLSDAMIDQTIFQAAAHSAEQEAGGVVVNIIPKTGGNTLSGSAFANFSSTSLQADNVDDDLRARGLGTPNPVDYTSDVSGSLGGKIVKDKLWFFGAYRDLRSAQFVSDRFPNALPVDGWRYTPDTSKQPSSPITTKDGSGRVSWQMSERNKVSVFGGYTPRAEPYFTAGPASLEATWKTTQLNRIVQGIWTMPATNRLLFEGAFSMAKLRFLVRPQADASGPSAFDLGTGTVFRSLRCGPCSSSALTYRDLYSDNYTVRGSVSYVTGAHAFRAGLIVNPATADFSYFSLSDYEVQLLNGVPRSVVFLPTPFQVVDSFNKVAAFIQDQWTVNKLTMNLGLRFDQFASHYPDVNLQATRLLPARSFPGANVLSWQDLAPRLGASYDLFGNGRTALKVSLSRYVAQEGTDLNRAVNPAVSSGGTLTRAWNDANGNFIPDGDPLNPAANGELGASPNNLFGTLRPTIRYDSDFANGFRVRPNMWETTAGVEHQIGSGLSANVTYFRRAWGRFGVTENQAVSPSDFSPYCITTPADARLPGGGGQQICGFYDISPARIGRVDNVGTTAEKFGKQSEMWQGVDVGLRARFANGGFLQGGLNSGSTTTDNCPIVTTRLNQVLSTSSLGAVQTTAMCHLETPFLSQFKLSGFWILPLGIEVSGLFQSVPGSAVSANFVATNAAIRPSLGRDLAAGAAGTVTVNVVAPGTMYGDRQNQTDLRLGRTFTVGSVRIKGMFDAYNLTNANPVLTWNNTYGTNGATWLRPLSILPGRLFKFGMQLDF